MLALLAALPAGADDTDANDQARRETTEKINRLLDQTGTALSGAGASTSSSELDSALGYSNELSSQLEQLRNVGGEGDAAKQMAEVWPGKT